MKIAVNHLFNGDAGLIHSFVRLGKCHFRPTQSETADLGTTFFGDK
jgi:hypothetical protein